MKIFTIPALCLFLLLTAVATSAFSVGGPLMRSPTRSITPLALSEETEEPVLDKKDESQPVAAPVKCPNCDLCDGSGRIAGGIGAVLPWWPIKAYRPCPNFIKRGGTYERSGQGLDEIAFGRDSTFNKD